jgi:hypothetical protein
MRGKSDPELKSATLRFFTATLAEMVGTTRPRVSFFKTIRQEANNADCASFLSE